MRSLVFRLQRITWHYLSSLYPKTSIDGLMASDTTLLHTQSSRSIYERTPVFIGLSFPGAGHEQSHHAKCIM
jgi:hypothetical protein